MGRAQSSAEAQKTKKFAATQPSPIFLVSVLRTNEIDSADFVELVGRQVPLGHRIVEIVGHQTPGRCRFDEIVPFPNPK